MVDSVADSLIETEISWYLKNVCTSHPTPFEDGVSTAKKDLVVAVHGMHGKIWLARVLQMFRTRLQVKFLPS